MRTLASSCGNNEKVSKDGDGVWQKKRVPGAWWQNLFHKCGEVSSASWYLFALLTGWHDCELRNWPPPKGQASPPLSRLSLAWCPAGETRHWGTAEQQYYRVTCKGMGAGEVGWPGGWQSNLKRQSTASKWLKTNDVNQTSLGLETFLLTYQGLVLHQGV